MVEPSISSSKVDTFIKQLFQLAQNPTFSSFSTKINEIISTTNYTSKLLASKSNSQLEVPSSYLESFLSKEEFKANPDVAIALLDEILETIQTYMNMLKKMAEEVTDRIIIGPNVIPVENPKLANLQIKPRCTIDIHGIKSAVQQAFYCETCSITGRGMVCEACALTCHAGHKLSARGMKSGYCDCRFETAICQLQEACTFKYTDKKHVAHQKFSCITCGMDSSKGQMMCQYCATNCHKGHNVVYTGSTKSGYCDCKTLYSFCHLNQ